jgi:hypothetical protein
VAEIIDIAPGLWAWRMEHPDWTPEADYDPVVTAGVLAEHGGEVLALDPLAPPEGDAVWERLDARPPTVVAILKPDHVRSVDAFVARYGSRAFGPWLFWRGDVPETELERLDAGLVLPGGAVALDDGRGRMEKPVWLPELRTIVFADSLTAPRGELLVWDSPLRETRVLPALREFLELPFERVVVAHGDPAVHDRGAFERALALPPWEE